MSDVARRPGLPAIVRLPGNRVSLTGSEAEISVVLAQLEERAMLAKVPPAPVETRVPGRYRIVAQLAATDPSAAAEPEAKPSFWTTRRAVCAAAAVVAVLALCGAAAVVALSWLAAHWAPILVVVVVLLVAAGGIGGRTFTFSGRGRIE
jgi:hypothetical protein